MNLATIIVTDENVIEKKGTKNGKDWMIREQAATIETADRKQPVRLDLGKSSEPFKAGRYTLDLLKNLNVSQFGSIQLRRNLELIPAK